MVFPIRKLSAFLDGELSDKAAARLRGHLAGCADCRRKLRELEETAGFLDEWDPGRETPPAAALGGLRQKVLDKALAAAGETAGIAAAAGRPESLDLPESFGHPENPGRPARSGLLAAAGLAALLAVALLSGWLAGSMLRRRVEPALPGISSLMESPEESLGGIYAQLLAQETAP